MTPKKPVKKAPAKAGAEKRAVTKRTIDWSDRTKGEPLLRDFVDAFEDWCTVKGDDELMDDYEEEHFLEVTKIMVKAIRKYLEHEVDKLPEALELRRPTGYRIEAARRAFEHKRALQVDGLQLMQAGAKINEAFFEVLGRIHGMGKTLAKEYWNDRRHRIPRENLRPADLPKHLEKYRHELDWIAQGRG